MMGDRSPLLIGATNLVECFLVWLRPRGPLFVESLETDFHLRGTGRIEGLTPRRLPHEPMFPGVGVDLLGALRKVADEICRNAPNLKKSRARIMVDPITEQNGRASGRERVCQYV